MQNSGDLNKILKEISNAASNQKRDKFTQKYGFVVCCETYNDKAGLHNLPSTKDDFSSVKRTMHMMNIDKRNIIKLIDVGYDELEREFIILTDILLA